MQPKKLSVLFLIPVLCLQLMTLHPQVSFLGWRSGDFVPVPPKDMQLLPQQLYEATFSSYAIDKKDSIIFTGDVLLARNVEFLMKREGVDYPYRGFSLSSLAPNPAIVGNFESAMPTAHVTTQALGMTFSVDPVFLSGLKAAGYTHLSLANNHSFDYGANGYENARVQLQQNGLTAFGNGEAVDGDSVTYIDTELGRVALVALNASEHLPDRAAVEKIMRIASRKSDIQIVCIHWGTEYETVHTYVQEELATSLVHAGADLIVGHHPHVVEDIGVIDGVMVFYSLGNYIFDQYFSTEVQEGLVLSLDMVDTIPVLRLVPVSSLGHLSQPSVMPPEAHRAFLKSLALHSDPALSADIEKGVIPLSTMVATSQKMAIMVR
jgi:gamma-polyglutamate biosynthesis protein CapA